MIMTKEDVKRKLANGKSTEEIRGDYFWEASIRLFEICNGSFSMKAHDAIAVLKEAGIDIDPSSGQECQCGYEWKHKMTNITLIIRGGGRWIDASICIVPDSGFRRLLFVDPAKLAAAVKEADARYPQILREWAELEKECIKFQKIKDLSEEAITVIVKEKLMGTGLEYNLTMNTTYVLLRIKMRRARYFEIRLPHDKFSDILTDALLEDIRNVAGLLNGIKYECRITRYGNDQTWHKSE